MPQVRLTWKHATTLKLFLREGYSTESRSRLAEIDIIKGAFSTIDITEFRQKAFLPEKPVLVTPHDGDRLMVPDGTDSNPGLPAAHKWFSKHPQQHAAPLLAFEYLSRFSDTILPYELIIDSREETIKSWIKSHGGKSGNETLSSVLRQLLAISNGESFHRFNAPLSVFLQACQSGPPALRRLYIAQAQIADLPRALQDDLPTPRLVTEAGKGDVYDANVWLGIPPTYTPLHRDPNPNLFVQLAGSKIVRLFPPDVGASIFHQVQLGIRQRVASASFRGDEMMEGPEREALDQAVWHGVAHGEGLEAVVRDGDALFIPKGWWHSIKSVGNDLTASVNWWFR